jgi:uncharacterized integral membrane protein
MRSYGLGIAFTMLVAALYAFQNKGEIIVRFLTWERALPQGVWEIALLALGCVAMWLISLSAMVETRNRNAGIIKDQKDRIAELEENVSLLKEEKTSLMIAIRRSGEGTDWINPEEDDMASSRKWEQDVTDYIENSPNEADADQEVTSEPENVPAVSEEAEGINIPEDTDESNIQDESEVEDKKEPGIFGSFFTEENREN